MDEHLLIAIWLTKLEADDPRCTSYPEENEFYITGKIKNFYTNEGMPLIEHPEYPDKEEPADITDDLTLIYIDGYDLRIEYETEEAKFVSGVYTTIWVTGNVRNMFYYTYPDMRKRLQFHYTDSDEIPVAEAYGGVDDDGEPFEHADIQLEEDDIIKPIKMVDNGYKLRHLCRLPWQTFEKRVEELFESNYTVELEDDKKRKRDTQTNSTSKKQRTEENKEEEGKDEPISSRLRHRVEKLDEKNDEEDFIDEIIDTSYVFSQLPDKYKNSLRLALETIRSVLRDQD